MSTRPIKSVLLIQNSHEEARRILEMFSDQGSYSFAVTRVERLADAEEFLNMHSVDVVLLDLNDCPDASRSETLDRVHAAGRNASIVLLIGPQDEEMALRAMDGTVQDYLVKGPMESHELMRALRNSFARKALEVSLFNEKNRAQITLQCIADAVICTDLDGNVTFLNPVAEQMTGWSLKNAIGRPLTDSFRIIDAATGRVAGNPTVRALGQSHLNRLPANCILTRRDGNQIFIEDSVAPILDHFGMPTGTVLVFRDVTAARALTARMAHLAEHDALTGLPNRLLLNDRLNLAITRANREAKMLAVFFLDLDNFKHVNDSLGHSIGDELLNSVARRLLDCIRAPDTVSRQGGDEFVLMLQDVRHAEDAAFTAKRILKATQEVHAIANHKLHITASVGISIYPNDGLDAETLLKNADTAMFQAKLSGRQTFRFFKPEMNVNAVERQSIEEDLRHAVERRELSLHYQPIVNLKSGAITGAEALLRWTNQGRGTVEPEIFIKVAEDCGLIASIGTWVLREACMQAKAWTAAGLRPITMSVNVSAHQFRNVSFLNSLNAILDETGLNPEALSVEVTESGIMERTRYGVPTLHAMRERGVQVAIDDFGTGYSSLSYLQTLQVDSLKIDQSFVRGISGTSNDTTLVSAIISMGRSLKLRIIAEGIESAEDLAFLTAHDCDEGQGYYFSHPVTATEFAALRGMQVN